MLKIESTEVTKTGRSAMNGEENAERCVPRMARVPQMESVAFVGIGLGVIRTERRLLWMYCIKCI